MEGPCTAKGAWGVPPCCKGVCGGNKARGSKLCRGLPLALPQSASLCHQWYSRRSLGHHIGGQAVPPPTVMLFTPGAPAGVRAGQRGQHRQRCCCTRPKRTIAVLVLYCKQTMHFMAWPPPITDMVCAALLSPPVPCSSHRTVTAAPRRRRLHCLPGCSCQHRSHKAFKPPTSHP